MGKWVMRTLLSIAIILLFSQLTTAQQKLEYPTLGFTITVPAGFLHQEGDGAIIMANQNMQNTMFVITMHEYKTLDEIRSIANEPYTDETGTFLKKSGDIEAVNDDALAANFDGYAGGLPAEAYMLGRVNPYGSGISIMGVSVNESTPAVKLKEVVLLINEGIYLKERDVGNVITEWTEKVNNTRLQYRSNYSSPSYSDGGISGYSSSSETFDICQQGYFTYSGSSSVSVGANDLSVLGNSNSNSQGNGTWEIDADSEGKPILKLKYYNGNVETYTLYYESGYLYMNDYKYTIGRGQEYGPACY